MTLSSKFAPAPSRVPTRLRRVGTRDGKPITARPSGGISEGRVRDGPLEWLWNTELSAATAAKWQTCATTERR